MNKEFIPYAEALALKELGFDEPCLGYWRNEDLPNPITIGQYTTKEDMDYEISGQDEYHNYKNIIALAPLYQQAFRWFREKYRLNSETPYLPNVEKYGIVVSDMTIKPKDLSNGENFKRGVEVTNNFSKYETPEEAELACLKKLIEIVKNK